MLNFLKANNRGFSKFGGVLVIALVVGAIAPPSISVTALIGAVPLVAAAIAITFFGVETRKRQLKEITEEQPGNLNIQPV